MTLGQSLDLLLSARQVTTDFWAAGEFARVVNRIAPFHNAAIQGPRASLRALRRNPDRFLWRALQLTAATLALWWLYKDEEWYTEMSPREKFLNWHFPTDWPEKTLVRLPRAFELGLFFSALPEAFVDSWYRRDPEGVKAWLGVFIENTIPNVAPVLLQEGAEQLANRDFYFHTPIVPMAEERRPPEEQFNEYTTRAAIALGDIFNVSPRRVDHALSGVFGYVATDILSLFGRGVKSEPREAEAADFPLFGRMFQRGGELGSRPASVTKLYDALTAAQGRQASVASPETEEERQRRLMLTDAARAVSALGYVRRFTERSEDRQALTREELEIARAALAAADSPDLRREYLAGLRRAAEEREAKLKPESPSTRSSARTRRRRTVRRTSR